MDQIVLIVAFVAFLAVGFWRKKGEQPRELRRFTLDKSKSRWFAIAAGISMTFVGGAATLNMASLGYQYGWSALIDPLAVLGGLLVSVFFVSTYRKGTGLTIADILAGSDRSLALFTGILTFVVYVLLTSAQFVALGKLVAPYFPQVPLVLLIGVVSSLIFSYVLFGGFASVTKTDILQYVCIFVLLVMPICYAAFQGAGSPVQQVDQTFQTMPLELFILFGFSLLFIPVSQDVNIRAKASVSSRSAVHGFLVGGLSYVVFVAACIYVGFVLAQSGTSLEDPETALSYFFATRFPVLGILAIVAVMAAIISTLDSLSFSTIVSCANDVIAKIEPFKRVSQSKQLLLAGSIVFVVASAIALYFTQILGLILTALLLYVSVLFPIVIGKILGLKSRVLLVTGILLVAFILIVEFASLPVSPKAVVYPASHLALVLLCRLFPQLRSKT